MVEAELCKIDLVDMLMFNEEESKAPALHVWHY